MNIILSFLRPLEWLIAQMLVAGHAVLIWLGMPDGPGLAWCLALMCLVLVIRICLLPLFIKQIRGMHRLQTIQPQLQLVQRKYAGRKDSRSQDAMRRETMALYTKAGTSPMTSCLPVLIQGPVLCSLFYTLQELPMIASGDRSPLGSVDRAAAREIEESTFMAAKLSSTFQTSVGDARLVIVLTIAVMCMALLVMQWLSIRYNTDVHASSAQQAMVQRVTMLLFPIMYVCSGLALPYGVLLYWMTSNLWNLGQTLVQLLWFPTPGSVAAGRKAVRDHERENRRRKAAGRPSLEEEKAEHDRRVAEARRANEAQHGVKASSRRRANKRRHR